MFTKTIPPYPKDIHRFISDHWSPAKKLVFAAFMATFAGVFQSAGGLLPGIGYLFSPFATAPILFSVLVSFRSGVLAYLLAACLLLMIQPSELVVYPFTTGLLGLSLGWTLRLFNRRLEMLFVNGITLTIGICIPLYVLDFPLLGPGIPSSFNMTVLIVVFIFSFLYGWLWLEFGLFLLRKLKSIWLSAK